jgi:hypothetical protein
MERRSITRGIGKNHELANDLWTAPDTNHRMPAVLVMDRKQISSDDVEARLVNIERMDRKKISKRSDGLLANQLLRASLQSEKS